MVHNNKILTVSYGTFSCTLEGFEDSFGTMKAIAEYFRELAAHDRYFGAEPPQPDAEMLALIAQREISRQVEARADGEGIVLRAAEAAVPAVATGVAAAAATSVMARNTQTEEAAEDAAPAPEPAADDMPDAEVAADATEETPAADATAPDEAAGDVAEAAPEAETAEVDGSIADDSSAEAMDEVAEVATASAIPTGNGDSIAAKLQRIRAVVSGANTQPGEYSEDQHSDGFVKAAAEDIEAAMEDAPEDPEAEDDPSVDALLAAVTAPRAEEVAETPQEEAPVEEAPVEEAPVEDLAEPAVETADADDIAEAEGESEDTIFADLDAEETEVEDAVETETAEVEDEDENNILAADEDAPEDRPAASAPPRGRVIKVKRADFEAALAAGNIEEEDDDDHAETAAAELTPAVEEETAPETSLSDEDEADLMRELAQVEAELNEDTTAEAAMDDTVAAPAPEPEMPEVRDDGEEAEEAEEAVYAPTRAGVAETDEADLSRLMAEADTQMDEPEASSRRDDFNQLRAAVAAAKADDSLSPASEEESNAPYREDLEQAVRPRRPGGITKRRARPEEARPAPLKLVAEQRVDTADAPATGPVRPRRISRRNAAAEAEAPMDGGFAEFAEAQGATQLPDLLEAAAAYMSFVEGQDQFSRPQLMSKVRQVGKGKFSREESLRSFGKLLRSGKIEKIQGGRFSASEDIGFRPDRAAG